MIGLCVASAVELRLRNAPKDETKVISIDDINVNDFLQIKGEQFIVLGYTKDNVFWIRRYGDNKEFYAKVDSEVKFIEHTKDGKRQYITVSGFKGTVGADGFSDAASKRLKILYGNV